MPLLICFKTKHDFLVPLTLLLCWCLLLPCSTLLVDPVDTRFNSTCYVRPNTSIPCPPSSTAATCITMFDLAAKYSDCITSQTAIKFMAGQHLMPSNSTILVDGISQLRLVGSGAYGSTGLNATRAGSVIQCHENGAFLFSNSRQISILDITFISCGSQVSYSLSNKIHTYMATLAFINVSDVTINHTSVLIGNGFGLFGINVIGNSTISHSAFIENSNGGNVYMLYQDLDGDRCPESPLAIEHSLVITNVTVLRGIPATTFFNNPTQTNISGCSIILHQTLYSVYVQVLNMTTSGNQGRNAANLHISVDAANRNRIKIDRCYSSLGGAADGGGGFAYYYAAPLPHNPLLKCMGGLLFTEPTILEITNSKFEHNYGFRSVSCPAAQCSSAVHMSFDTHSDTRAQYVAIDHTHILNSTGSIGAALNIFEFSPEFHYRRVDLLLSNSIFANSSSTLYRKEFQGAVYVGNIRNITISNCTFTNNSATAVIADETTIYFCDTVSFYGNSGYNGGALALYANTFLYLTLGTHLWFTANKAENFGGAIYIADVPHTASQSLCFIQFGRDLSWYAQHWNWTAVPIRLNFLGNEAGFAGEDLYGGSLETCVVDVGGLLSVVGWQIVVTGSLFVPSYLELKVASKPSRACLCDENANANCGIANTSVSVYPGALFDIKAVAVGQWLTPVPATINSILLDSITRGSGSRISELQSAQDVQNICTQLSFEITSAEKEEIIAMTMQRSDNKKLIEPHVLGEALYWFEYGVPTEEFLHLPVYIFVHLLPCPLGFELSKQNRCECAHYLKQHHITCQIQDLTILRETPKWIGVLDALDTGKVSYAVHKHCPFDYCKSEDINIRLNSTDAQCDFNRSGILCGECIDGLSQVLGSSKCQKCSNTYLTLLVVFIISGILLIVFLIITDLTLATGTISGLVFYANVIGVNKAVLFPSRDFNLLTVFIAWLNLDLGIETCFYDGMDAYAKAWLQFLFPVYIWILAGAIILASRRYIWVGKLCRRNIVRVLATLFFLSYSKLQRSIITVVSFTVLKYDGGTDLLWLYDGNVSYLRGKHIALFLVGIVALFGLFLPYTLVILLVQWLQPRSKYRVLQWVPRLKPFFDANLGPYKDKLRYWVGLLLLARATLIVIQSGNILGDPTINLLATAVVADILMIGIWVLGGVYKTWSLNLLECSFLLNLSIFSSVTLFNGPAGGSQATAAYISTGVAFTTFIGILLYSVLMKAKHYACFESFLKQVRIINGQVEPGNRIEAANGANQEVDSVDTPVVQVSALLFNELREPLLMSANEQIV